MKKTIIITAFIAALALIFSGCDTGGGGGSPVKYNVEFDLQGRASDLPTEAVEKGAKVSEPEAPVSDKYDFVHWYVGDDSSVPYDFDTPVNGDLILIALWKVKEEVTKFTVHFYLGDDMEELPVQEVADGDKISKPLVDPVLEGFTFAYWYFAVAETPFDFNTPITMEFTGGEIDITITAKWDDDSSGPWIWMTFDDKKENTAKDPTKPGVGKSEISLKKEKTMLDGEEVTVYAVSGTTRNGFQYPFAGLIAEVNPGHEDYETLIAELRSATSFSFWISGNRTYQVKLPQPNLKGPMELMNNSAKPGDSDYGVYGTADSSHYTTVAAKTVEALTTPTKITLRIPQDFAQPSWGTPKKNFTKDEITQINWQTNDFGTTTTTFNFKIWGLELHQE